MPFTLLLSILILGLGPIGRAGVTVSWHASPELIESLPGEHPELKEAPGASAFFGKGDRLLDLSAVVAATAAERWSWLADRQDEPLRALGKWHGEWAVWNERTRRVAIRGRWDEVLSAACMLGLSNQSAMMRVHVMLKKEGDQTHSVTLLADPSGSASAKVGDLELSINGGGFQRDAGGWLTASWMRADGADWNVEAGFPLAIEKPVTVARVGGKDGWELKVRVGLELADGSAPDGDPQVEQEDGKITSLERGSLATPASPDHRSARVASARLATGWALDVYQMQPFFPEGRPIWSINGKSPLFLSPLEEWKPLLGGSLSDFTDPITTILKEKFGLTPSAGTRVGISQWDQQLFVIAPEGEMAALRNALEPAIDLGSASGPLWMLSEGTFPGGDWSLTGEAGLKALISCSKRDHAETPEFEVLLEPVARRGDSLIDSFYSLTLPGPRQTFSLNGAASLTAGLPTELAKISGPQGDGVVSLKISFLRTLSR